MHLDAFFWIGLVGQWPSEKSNMVLLFVLGCLVESWSGIETGCPLPFLEIICLPAYIRLAATLLLNPSKSIFVDGSNYLQSIQLFAMPIFKKWKNIRRCHLLCFSVCLQQEMGNLFSHHPHVLIMNFDYCIFYLACVFSHWKIC